MGRSSRDHIRLDRTRPPRDLCRPGLLLLEMAVEVEYKVEWECRMRASEVSLPDLASG